MEITLGKERQSGIGTKQAVLIGNHRAFDSTMKEKPKTKGLAIVTAIIYIFVFGVLTSSIVCTHRRKSLRWV